MCRRAFQLEDLRAGKAEIREARVLCPRCIARLDRKRPRVDYRFIAALAFILIVFPVSAAFLIHFALSSPSKTQPEKSEESSPNPTVEDLWGGGSPVPDPPAEAPLGEAARGEVPGRPPVKKDGGTVKGIPRADLNQILKNLREGRGGVGGPPAPPVLDDSHRGSAAPAPLEAMENVEEMVRSPDPAVRLEGILRLGRAQGGSGLLIEALSDSDPFVRSLAATALGQRKDENAIAPLLELIRDPVFMVRKAASVALVESANMKIKFAEDFTADELEGLKKYLDELSKKKKGE
jgi:hypothetical protein